MHRSVKIGDRIYFLAGAGLPNSSLEYYDDVNILSILKEDLDLGEDNDVEMKEEKKEEKEEGG